MYFAVIRLYPNFYAKLFPYFSQQLVLGQKSHCKSIELGKMHLLLLDTLSYKRL
jgi:hypothetical protein